MTQRLTTGPTTFNFGDLVAEYSTDPEESYAGLSLVPVAKIHERVTHRTSIRGTPEIEHHPRPQVFPHPWKPEPLVQLKWRDDASPAGFAAGQSMRNSPSVASLQSIARRVETDAGETTVCTTLKDAKGAHIRHFVKWRLGTRYVEIWCDVENGADSPRTLEMLSSFTLGGITPFARDDAPERLLLHRFRSRWSAEARLESRSLESMGLERSWAGFGTVVERFGQVGSMPVRGFFPHVAIEDTAVGVVWAACLGWGGSWQMEVARQGDAVALSGGLADAEFGHWRKTLAPGERFETPRAFLTVVAGDLTEACHRLLEIYEPGLEVAPESEREGAIVFNDWCQSWGDPSEQTVEESLARLTGTVVGYFVIDAGWFVPPGGNVGLTHGDWNPSETRFPQGMQALAARIRAAGLIPGLWFELETCGEKSALFHREDLLLHAGGKPLTTGTRRFLDLSNPDTIAYLDEKVIGPLKEWDFDYLKLDYNEALGTELDGPCSPGETLRAQTGHAYEFITRIQREKPGIVIENCASGGHRLEYGFVSRTALSSFSDAHESREIPLIAASLQLLIPPAQSLVWAVLHPDDPPRRLVFSLAATFLGRVCLSGPVGRITDDQWCLVQEGLAFYRKCWPVIRRGTSRICGDVPVSRRHPRGWQAVVRQSAEGSRCLVVLHVFAREDRQPMSVPLPAGGTWKVAGQFPSEGLETPVRKGTLEVALPEDFSAIVLWLEREPGFGNSTGESQM